MLSYDVLAFHWPIPAINNSLWLSFESIGCFDEESLISITLLMEQMSWYKCKAMTRGRTSIMNVPFKAASLFVRHWKIRKFIELWATTADMHSRTTFLACCCLTADRIATADKLSWFDGEAQSCSLRDALPARRFRLIISALQLYLLFQLKCLRCIRPRFHCVLKRAFKYLVTERIAK